MVFISEDSLQQLSHNKLSNLSFAVSTLINTIIFIYGSKQRNNKNFYWREKNLKLDVLVGRKVVTEKTNSKAIFEYRNSSPPNLFHRSREKNLIKYYRIPTLHF